MDALLYRRNGLCLAEVRSSKHRSGTGCPRFAARFLGANLGGSTESSELARVLCDFVQVVL
jgi:hypothetical protein